MMHALRQVLCVALVLPALALAQESSEPAPAPTPRVSIKTSLGEFVIELDRERAPLTVENFLHYVRSGHYEGTLFHRVVQGFVAQAGGYDADFKEKETDRTVVNESGNGLSNRRGTVGLARTGEPHSGNAQFYINLVDNVALDPNPARWGYTVFGRVVQGMDVIDEIGYQPTSAGPPGTFPRSVPVQRIFIEAVEELE
jgi:peptidyl-prolyl cis-trans isomerase A (cyclophilin A)/peptidyl-prolyl cis-trans isomerase B (cyclophilin B)